MSAVEGAVGMGQGAGRSSHLEQDYWREVSLRSPGLGKTCTKVSSCPCDFGVRAFGARKTLDSAIFLGGLFLF